MAHTKGRRTFLLRSGLWVTAGLVTAGTGLGLAQAQSRNPWITLYEGNNASQTPIVSYYGSHNGRVWPNDEARSAVLWFCRKGTIVTLYDSPRSDEERRRKDDWCKIEVIEDVSTEVVTVPTFEATREYANDKVKVEYYPKNGLDGKVSYARIILP